MQERQGSNKVPIGDSVLSMADVRCHTIIVFSGSELSDDLFVFALSHFRLLHETGNIYMRSD